MSSIISFIMSLASGKGTYSSAASRGLDAQEEARRLLKFHKPTGRSETSNKNTSADFTDTSTPSIPSSSMRPRTVDQDQGTFARGTQPTAAQEAARISEMMSHRRQVPENLSNARGESDRNNEGFEDTGEDEGNDRRSDPSTSQEQAPSVTDVGKLQDPYAEDRSMRQKMDDANRRQAQAIGTPGGSGTNAPQATTGTQGTTTGTRGPILERARGSVGQAYGQFQRELQASKRKDDAESKDKLKALAASKGSSTIQQANMIKERIEKLRDLFTMGTGVGVAYYVLKLDVTMTNRYFLKRPYLWGYRDKQEYEGNKMLRLNDNLDIIEWFAWLFIRVIMTLTPIMILFIWVILPILAAHQAATRILGPALAEHLMRIIHH